MIRKDWYVVSDSAGRASYVKLAAIAAVHLQTDGYDVDLVEEPVMVPGQPLRTPISGWTEVEVRENLKGGHDCTVNFVDAEFLYQDIPPAELLRLGVLFEELPATVKWNAEVAFGFVLCG